MYRFLSAVYLRPPTQDLVRQFRETDFLDELSSLFGDESVTALREFSVTARRDEDFADLKREYMDLFAVPMGRYATPFEDVYRGVSVDGKQERGPLLGERAIAVKRLYRQAGAEMDQASKELPTHIGVELSFMAFLCEREAEAIRGGKEEATDSTAYRDLQLRFLQEHLAEWFPRLSQSIQASATSQFYRGLAVITEEFLAQDMGMLLVQPDLGNTHESKEAL
jgi:DMSO reductase family type II enzyme chaperone